jgi:hypothetical protein
MSQKKVTFDFAPKTTKSSNSEQLRPSSSFGITQRSILKIDTATTASCPPITSLKPQQTFHSNPWCFQNDPFAQNISPLCSLQPPNQNLNPILIRPTIFDTLRENQPFVGLGSHQIYPAVQQNLLDNKTPNSKFLKAKSFLFDNRYLDQEKYQTWPPKPENSIHDQVLKKVNNPYERFSLSDRPEYEKKPLFEFWSKPASSSQPSNPQRSLNVIPNEPKRTLFNGLEENDESLASKFCLNPNSRPKRLIIRKKE